MDIYHIDTAAWLIMTAIATVTALIAWRRNR